VVPLHQQQQVEVGRTKLCWLEGEHDRSAQPRPRL
jgi:hypothetical protein